MGHSYLWVKAFHIVFISSWFAGLFYLPRLFVNLAILFMALSFMWWGRDFYIQGSRQQSEISGLPMIYIYGAWPLAGATWTLFTLERIWNDFANFRMGEFNGAR